jgi:hypothetical protein
MSKKAERVSQQSRSKTAQAALEEESGSAESAAPASNTKLADVESASRESRQKRGEEGSGDGESVHESDSEDEDRGAELDRRREMLKRENKAVTALAEEFSKAKATMEEKVAALECLELSMRVAKGAGQPVWTTAKQFMTNLRPLQAGAMQRLEASAREQSKVTSVSAVRAVAGALRVPEMAFPTILRHVKLLDASGEHIVEEAAGTVGDRLIRARVIANILGGSDMTLGAALQHTHVPLRRYVSNRNQTLPPLTSATFEAECVAVIDRVDEMVRMGASAAPAVVATTLVVSNKAARRRNRRKDAKDNSDEFHGKCFRCDRWGHRAKECKAATAAADDTPTPPVVASATTEPSATKEMKKPVGHYAMSSLPLGQHVSQFPHGVMQLAISDAPLGISVCVASASGVSRTLTMAIDTGASPPVISKQLVTALQLPLHQSNCKAVKGIDAQVTSVLGEVRVCLQVGLKWVEMLALVLEAPVFELLAGVSWLKVQHTCISLKPEGMAISFLDGPWIPAVDAPISRVQSAVAGVVVGCEKIVAEAVRAHDAEDAEMRRLPPWKLSQSVPVSTQRVGEPALRGDDLTAYTRVEIAEDLPESIQAELRALNHEFADVFASGGPNAASIPPCANVPPMTIDLKPNADLSRVVAKAHRMSADDQRLMDEFVDCGVRDGLLVPVPNAPCTSKAFVVFDADGRGRIVGSYVSLNQETQGNANQPPNTNDIIAKMASDKFVRRSAIDGKKSYFALPMAEESIPLTATLFCTSRGPRVYGFTRVPMGVKSAPGWASIHFGTIFTGGIEHRAFQFIDDSSLGHATDSDVVRDVREHYRRARAAGVTLNATKTFLGFRSLEVLGKIVGQGTIEPRADYMQGIREHAQPTTRKQLQSWLGLFTSIATHLPGARDVVAVLESEKGKRGPLVWTQEMNVAFERSKALCAQPEVCTPFDTNRKLFVLTDASGVGGSVIFAHLSNDASRFELVDVFSHRWNGAELAYHASQGEFVILRIALEKAPHLMRGRPLFWVCDALIVTQAMRSLHTSHSARVRRTLLELSELEVYPIHVPGVQNKIADALSRNPAWQSEATVSPIAAGVEVDDVEEGEVLSQHEDDDDDDDVVENPLQRVGREPLPTPSSDDDEPDLMFMLPGQASNSAEAWRVRWRARVLDDPALSMLREQASEREEQRVAGVDVPDLDDKRVVLPDWGPDGLLYVRVGDDEFWRLVVPEGCYNEVLNAAHAGAGVAHWSARRVTATLRRWFWWQSMYSDVVKWCAQCVPCQRRRVLEESARLGDSEEAGEPIRLQQWQLDSFHIGGALFVVAVELFAGVVWCQLLKDATSAAMARAVESGLFLAFGVPVKVRTDGGSEFARDFQTLCAAYGVELETGQANNPRSQAVVERALRTLRDGVTAMQIQGSSSAPIEVLVARVAIAINAAPSDDEWHISPSEMLLGRVERPLSIARYVDHGLTGLAQTSVYRPLKELLDEQEAIFNKLATLRHKQRQQERAKHEAAFAQAHRDDSVPVVGELRWTILPLDLKKQGKDDTRRRATLIRVTAFSAVNGRVEGVLELDVPSPAAPARVVVHARRTWPFEVFKSIDDVALIDNTVLPLDWETRVAPLGGLAMLSKGAMHRLRQAQKARARQDSLSVAQQAKAKADEDQRVAAQAAADAKVKAEAAKAERAREAEAAEERRRAREVVEVLQKRWQSGDVVGEYLIRRRDGSTEWMRRSDSQLPTDVVERYNTKIQQQHREERARLRQQRERQQRADDDEEL